MDVMEGLDRRIGYALEKITLKPRMSYVQDATQQYPKEVMKLDELRAKVDPMALQFCSEPISWAQIQHTHPTRTDILRTLFDLNDRAGRSQFDYIDVMQDYIELLRTHDDNIGQFRSLFENLKTLTNPWLQSYTGSKNVELIDVVPQISPDIAPFIEYTNNLGGKLGEFFKSLIEKVHNYVEWGNQTIKDKAQKLFIMCRIFLERVIPILDVLTNLNNTTPEGRTFINNLNLDRLIRQMMNIQKPNVTPSGNSRKQFLKISFFSFSPFIFGFNNSFTTSDCIVYGFSAVFSTISMNFSSILINFSIHWLMSCNI